MKRDEWDVSCPDGVIMHGPADVRGRCPWCGNKVTNALPAPRAYPRSDLSEFYGYYFDPDEGAAGALERMRQLRAGTEYY